MKSTIFFKNTTPELIFAFLFSASILFERGRYFRPRIPRDQRICKQCNRVEDEEHIIL